MIEFNHQRPLDRVTYSSASLSLVVLATLLATQQSNEIDNLPKKVYSIVSSSSSSSINDYFSINSKYHSELMKKLIEIEKLNNNWNGFGAAEFSSELINRSKDFLAQVVSMSPVISIFPTASGSIQIEWEKENKYAEAEIFSDHVKIYSEKNNEEVINLSFDNINDSASQFMSLYNT